MGEYGIVTIEIENEEPNGDEEEVKKEHEIIEIECLVELSRPATRCSNHDDPAFSDPGEDGDLEIRKIKYKNGEAVSAKVIKAMRINDDNGDLMELAEKELKVQLEPDEPDYDDLED